MTETGQQAAAADDPTAALAQQEQLSQDEKTTVAEYARSWWQGVCAGDLGSPSSSGCC